MREQMQQQGRKWVSSELGEVWLQYEGKSAEANPTHLSPVGNEQLAFTRRRSRYGFAQSVKMSVLSNNNNMWLIKFILVVRLSQPKMVVRDCFRLITSVNDLLNSLLVASTSSFLSWEAKSLNSWQVMKMLTKQHILCPVYPCLESFST